MVFAKKKSFLKSNYKFDSWESTDVTNSRLFTTSDESFFCLLRSDVRCAWSCATGDTLAALSRSLLRYGSCPVWCGPLNSRLRVQTHMVSVVLRKLCRDCTCFAIFNSAPYQLINLMYFVRGKTCSRLTTWDWCKLITFFTFLFLNFVFLWPTNWRDKPSLCNFFEFRFFLIKKNGKIFTWNIENQVIIYQNIF